MSRDGVLRQAARTYDMNVPSLMYMILLFGVVCTIGVVFFMNFECHFLFCRR